MSRTDLVKLAIEAELERHRAEIDTNDGLRSLTFTVKLNRGQPRLVIVTRETEQPAIGAGTIDSS